MIEKNFKFWHDVINNSLSKHRSNNYKQLTPESLIEILKDYKNKIPIIIYVHRQNTPIFIDVCLKQEYYPLV